MIDLAPLAAPSAPAKRRELASDDPLLDEVVSLADHNQLREAALRAQDAWRQDIRDIRLVGFYLFGAFLQDGLSALPAILRCIDALLGEGFVHLGPQENKARHGEGALRWLFTAITGQVRFAQRQQREEWQGLLQSWAALPQAQLFASMDQSSKRLSEVLGGDSAQSSLYGLVAWLKRLPASSPGPGGAASAERGEPAPEATAHDHEAPTGAALALIPTPTPTPTPATISVPLSPPLHRLLRKLEAFGRLVALGKFRHAAIVYKDIQASLGSFDPRQYLPSLFGEYYSHVVAHADKLTKHLSEDKGLVAETLKELYQTDLDLFVSSKG